MSRLNLFIIRYKFFGKSKSLILRNAEMNNSDAWHWASCDAGVAPLPQPASHHSRSFPGLWHRDTALPMWSGESLSQ
jgi:hypothetical protein